jgi:PilZ domain
MHVPPRQRARIVPPNPITVGFDDENGLPLGYGVIANVSDAGGCIWTDGRLEPGARLSLRVSFAQPPEVHHVAAMVVWADESQAHPGGPIHRYGLRWQDASSACVKRLHALAMRANGGRFTPAFGTEPVPKPPGGA